MNPFLLALVDLCRQPGRTGVSLLGVAGSVLLSFVQLGLLHSLETTAGSLYEHLNGDLVLVSSEYVEMRKAYFIPRERRAQALGVAGVADAWPVTIARAAWRDPRRNPALGTFGETNAVTIVAVPPHRLGQVFRPGMGTFDGPEALARARIDLARPDTVLIDSASRPEFGDREDLEPGHRDLLRLNTHPVEVVGWVHIGTGFNYNGLLVTSEETIARCLHVPDEHITCCLIQLAPGVTTEKVRQRLTKRFEGMEDVRVLTHREWCNEEVNYWVWVNPIGVFFLAGVVMAGLVGLVFVSQVMARGILKRLPEYAIIRALGYSQAYLNMVVVSQSVLLSVGGFLLGLGLAGPSFLWTWRETGLPMRMTENMAIIVFGLTLLVCLASGYFAMRALKRANPADLL